MAAARQTLERSKSDEWLDAERVVGYLEKIKQKEPVMLEKFERIRGPRRAGRFNTPLITIQSGPRFAFSRPAWELINNAPFVELFYDPIKRQVAFKPSWEDMDNCYKVTSRGSDNIRTQVYVSGQGFASWAKITLVNKQAFVPYVKEGLLFIDLKG